MVTALKACGAMLLGKSVRMAKQLRYALLQYASQSAWAMQCSAAKCQRGFTCTLNGVDNVMVLLCLRCLVTRTSFS